MEFEELNYDVLTELGKFTNHLKQETIKKVHIGTKAIEIVEFIENNIFDKNYLPAFPCTICINETTAHFTIYDEDISFKKGDVVKIDFGVSFKGLITDTAFTIEIEDNKYEKLLKANIEALDKALEVINEGVEISKIGETVHNIAKKNGFNTIHNLSGHEIGINNLHAGLHIPNYNNHSKRGIPNNSEIAIEPFFTVGEPLIKEGKPGNILHLKEYRAIRDPIAKPILEYINKNYPKLPFSKRWLLKKFEKRKVDYSIKILKKENIIYEYGVLISIDNKITSQFEDTVLIKDKQKTIITRL